MGIDTRIDEQAERGTEVAICTIGDVEKPIQVGDVVDGRRILCVIDVKKALEIANEPKVTGVDMLCGALKKHASGNLLRQNILHAIMEYQNPATKLSSLQDLAVAWGIPIPNDN